MSFAECNIFPEGSRKWKICRGEALLSEAKIDSYRVSWGMDRLFGEQTKRIKLPAEYKVPEFFFHGTSVGESETRRKLYGPGTELLAIYEASKIPTCDACKELAQDMNDWGIEGCRSRLDEIVADILPRAKAWIDNEYPWSSFFVPDVLEEFGIEVKIRRDVRRAIAAAEETITQRLKRREHPQTGKPIIAIGCSTCGGGDAWNQRRGGVAPTADQTKRYNAVMAEPNPAPDPFTGTPVLHFGGHLWPVKGYWQRHADAWNKLAEMIEGRCVVGVVTDGESDSFETVRKALTDRIELFEAPNTPEGENPTFAHFQQTMPRGQNDVFLYAHGKGCRQRTFNSKAIDLWIEMMYAVLFDHKNIITQMANGYKMVGAVRMFGEDPHQPQFGWHYAGTFWALRAKYFPGTVVQPVYGGVEAWPGQNFPASECRCEFLDNIALRALYLDKYMMKQRPLFEQWKERNASSRV